jgi:serine phosphatase RsbU (regulator of sigma subunit)
MELRGTLSDLRSGRRSQALVTIPLGLIVVITVVDIFAPAEVHLGPFLVAAPALTAMFAGPRMTGCVGALAVMAQAVIAGIRTPAIMFDLNHTLQLIALFVISVVITFLAHARKRHEKQLHALREQVLTETRTQLSLLTSLADADLHLSATLDPDQVLDTAGQILLPDLADQVSFHLTDPGAPTPAYTVGTPLSAREVLATAAAHVLHGSAPPDPDPAVLALPLRARDGVLGALVLARHSGSYSAVEHKYLENLAQRLALAYDTATRYQRERHLALTLQRALLPHRLPDAPGLHLASHYQASTRGAEVGGDFYDVLALPDGAVGLAIGDVMGHDVEAATIMGQLRSALHGLALEGAGPAQVLTKLDAYLQTLETDRFATCLYATYHPESRRLRYAASGHLPPLLVAGEHTGYLELPPALPLGLGSHPTDRQAAVPPGAGLLLYTDGLVENRALPLDTGLAALRTACRALPTAARTDPQQLIDRALALLNTPGRADDDIALLAATTEPSHRTCDPQADGSAIQPTATARSHC